MLRKLFIFLLIAVTGGIGNQARAQKAPKLYFDQKQFFSPEIGNYVELSFEMDAGSLNYRAIEGGLVADIAFQINLSQDNQTVKTDSYRIQSPIMKDSIVENFFDVKRFALTPGKYNLDLKVYDLVANSEPVSATIPISVYNFSTTGKLSGIQLIETAIPSENTASPFYKSGIELLPKMNSYYSNDMEALPYYVEIYNTQKLSHPSFGLRQRIVDGTTGEVLDAFTQFYRLDTAQVVPVLKKIDLSQLYTGYYELELAVLDRNMEVLDIAKKSIERTNEPDIQMITENIVLDPVFTQSITPDSALFYLASLIPIAKSETQRVIMNTLKERNNDLALRTIQSFWVATSGASQATSAWLQYKSQVLWVQQLYKTNFQDGFETDRGRVYLQYGSPTNIIQREASASEYPYEIWQYNKIGRFSNKRFIFYNRDLIGNNYALLHSDMIGELRNNNWPYDLNQRNTTKGNIDNPNENIQQHYGGTSQDLFRQY